MQTMSIAATPVDISAADTPVATSTPRTSSGEKSWKQKKKEALLRKNNLSSQLPPEVPAPATPPLPPHAAKLTKSGEKEQSWSEKRMASYLSRHGTRSPRASHDDLSARSESSAPTSPRAPGELSWTAKRKELHLRKYGFAREEETTQADVAVSAVKFISKLRVKTNEAKATSAAPTRPASASSEKSWRQQRKEAYLRKYGKARATETTDADVAVTAIQFASKLKLKIGKSSA